MKNKLPSNFLLIAVAIVALGALFFYAQPNEGGGLVATASQASVLLSADRASHDFGVISMKDGNVTTNFNIINSTDEPVFIKKIYTSCMCTGAWLTIDGVREGPFGMPGHGLSKNLGKVVAPGEILSLDVSFDPNAHGPSGIGKIERFVIFEGDDGELLSVGIKATVTP